MPAMRHLVNKLAVFAVCCALLYGTGGAGVRETFAPEMAALLVAAVAGTLYEVVCGRWRGLLPLAGAAAVCAVPGAAPAVLPLTCYDLTQVVWVRWPARWPESSTSSRANTRATLRA